MRRNKQDSKSAAEFAIMCLHYQRKNKARHNALFFSYEELCEKGEVILKKIVEFVPELNDIDANIEFTSHNFKSEGKMKMINLNEEKISKISDNDLEIINSVFVKEEELLNLFNYKILKR